MKKAHFILTAFLLLAACAQPAPLLTASPTPSPTRVAITATSIPTKNNPTPRPTASPRPTLTPWIKTYPTKKALLIYGASARTQISQIFIDRGYFEFNPFLTLYEDGQIIFGPQWREKQLSPEKTAEIMANLEQLGFFKIQETYPADPQNPIYALPANVSPEFNASLPLIHVTVNGQETKEIVYEGELEKYLSQPMRDIVSYLDSIPTEEATPYHPDRLLVGMISEDEIPLEGEPAIPWPEDIPPLSQRTRYDGVLYLEGTEAQKLYKIYSENQNNIYSYDGKKYQVYVRPILPNECQVYHFEENPPGEDGQVFFHCDDW